MSEHSAHAVPAESLAEAKRRLMDAFGDRLEQVILYGSEARGEAREDSDVDLMLLLKGPIRLWDDIQTALEAIYPVSMRLGRQFSPKPVDIERFGECQFPLYAEVHREGVPL
jgi:predicted nucleotidyltransferase